MIGAALTVAGVLLLVASSTRARTPIVREDAIPLTEAQRDAVAQIEDVAQRWAAPRGLSDRLPALVSVLVANAWGESRLNPSAVGDGGASVGLFQLHTTGGVGREILEGRLELEGVSAQPRTVAELKDARTNARGILAELAKQPRALEELRSGSLGSAVAAFVRYVERPDDTDGEASRRTGYAVAFSGRPATTPTAEV